MQFWFVYMYFANQTSSTFSQTAIRALTLDYLWKIDKWKERWRQRKIVKRKILKANCQSTIVRSCFECWTFDVSRTASYEITFFRLSIYPSVRPTLSFLKIGSLVLSDIVHDDSWPSYLVTDEARFLKKNLVAQIWAKWAKIRPKPRFFAIISILVR